jgi:hypothetical protein
MMLAEQIEDLVHDTCQPKRREIGSAPERLADLLGGGEPVRATLAAVGGQQGIALVATSGVYFAAADPEGPAVAFSVARMAGVSPPNRTEVKIHTQDRSGVLLEDFVSTAQCAQFAGLIGALIFDGPEQLVQLADDFDSGVSEPELPPLPPPPGQARDNSTAFAGAFTAVAAIIGGISLLWLFGLSSVVIHDTEAEAQAQACQVQWSLECESTTLDPTDGTGQYDCGTIGGTFSRQDNNTGTVIEEALDEACQKQALKQGWPIAGAVLALIVACLAIKAW